jgi:hypothetical protein
MHYGTVMEVQGPPYFLYVGVQILHKKLYLKIYMKTSYAWLPIQCDKSMPYLVTDLPFFFYNIIKFLQI